ncbi:MAG TPA: polyprenyl diphosphate synthase [Opitutales bacterium]|nr:polyprenyl diphosphate synthase [Opitutales bacterium]
MDSQGESKRALPTHVAIIMDGNGRWAAERGLPRSEGHRHGVAAVKKIVKKAGDLGLRFLTLYAFSAENWNRPKHEVDFLMRLLGRFLDSQAKEILKSGLRLATIGDIQALPESVRTRLDKLIAASAGGERGTLVLALNYGSRQEIVSAARTFAEEVAAGREKPENLDWPKLSGYLQTRDIPDPDLVIRTSGELRISNFLLLQSAYAEYWFCDKYWPDFGPEDFQQALEAYSRRERRFGRTGAQLKTDDNQVSEGRTR